MNYIDEFALDIFRRVELGDAPSERDWLLYRVYAVLARGKGEAVTSEDVHDAWAVWAAQYEPDHRSLVPFSELPEFIQRLDEPYAEAIRVAAREGAGDVRTTH